MWAVDALGRRNTTIYGSCGMAVSQLIVAITGAAISVNNQAGQKVLVAFTCIFIGEEIFAFLAVRFVRGRQTDRLRCFDSSLCRHLGTVCCTYPSRMLTLRVT